MDSVNGGARSLMGGPRPIATRPPVLTSSQPKAMRACFRSHYSPDNQHSSIVALCRRDGSPIMPDDLAPRGFYDGLTARHLLPGWMRGEQPSESQSDMRIHVWRGDEARAALQEASGFV